MIHRGIVYTLGETHIKLFNRDGVHEFKDSAGNYSTYRNGELYVSYPEDMSMSKASYAKKVINSLYDRMMYYQEHENKKLLDGSKRI